MRFEHEGISLSYGTPDASAPEGAVQAGTEVTITVGVQPIDASNKVKLLYRINQGSTETVAAKWLFNDTSRKTQYFSIRLPAFRAGDTVEYIAICRCAGRQVPSPEEAQQFRSSFHVKGVQAYRPERLSDYKWRILEGRFTSDVLSPSSPPQESPLYRGRNAVARAILGVAPGTAAMPTPSGITVSSTEACHNPPITISTPSAIPAIVYYPAITTSYDTSEPIDINIKDTDGPYPVVLYAHAARHVPCVLPSGAEPGLQDITRDYTLAGSMLDHVSSYGCVVVAPDLSWLVYSTAGRTAFDERSLVLVSYYQYLSSLNQRVFSGLLDLNRLMLVGHSTGGGACLVARRDLVARGGPRLVAMGLIAPATRGDGQDVTSLAAEQAPNGLLVLQGTVDDQVGQDPVNVYNQARAPKAIVTIPGANHFGYTDICSADNKVCAVVLGNVPGTISRFGQQLTAGAYLAALLRRFALGDMTVLPYLDGQRIVEVDIFGVTGVTLQQSGMDSVPLTISGNTSAIVAEPRNECDPFPVTRHFTSNASPADRPNWTVEPAGAANIASPSSVETDVVFTQQPGAPPAVWRVILTARGQRAEVHVPFQTRGHCR